MMFRPEAYRFGQKAITVSLRPKNKVIGWALQGAGLRDNFCDLSYEVLCCRCSASERRNRRRYSPATPYFVSRRATAKGQRQP
jgi:hypothetical protein